MIFNKLAASVKKIAESLKPQIRKNLKKRETLALALFMAVLGTGAFCGFGTASADNLTLLSASMETASISENAGAAGIFVDKELIAILPDTETALKAMYAFEASFVTPGAEVIEIAPKEELVVSPAKVDPSEYEEIYFSSADAAARYLQNGTTEPLVYTMQSGDNLWDVALSNGISYYELLEMNPQIDSKIQHVGDVVYLYERKPFAEVVVKERVRETVDIPFNTVYEYTDTLYSGQSVVKSPGVKGKKETVTEYVRENGKDISSELISETVLSDPVSQESYLGTATIQIQTGSGQLQSPVASIKVNSGFGTARTGHTHKGVDFGGNAGDPIYAADDGTVIVSKSSAGTYGKVIKIDHGNGMVTVYAHLSELIASVGDNVSKGQLIGLMGRTGNATGNLLHFEVQMNGAAKDPMNYL